MVLHFDETRCHEKSLFEPEILKALKLSPVVPRTSHRDDLGAKPASGQ